MYLSREQEMTVFRAAEKLLAPVKSNSPLRKLGEGTIGDPIDLIRFMDGNIHPILVDWLAGKGDTNEIARLQELANADLTRFPDRAYGKRLAHEMLEKLAQPASATPPQIIYRETYPPPPAVVTPEPPTEPTILGVRDNIPVESPKDTGAVIGDTYRTVDALLNEDIPGKTKAALIDVLKQNTNTGEETPNE